MYCIPLKSYGLASRKLLKIGHCVHKHIKKKKKFYNSIRQFVREKKPFGKFQWKRATITRRSSTFGWIPRGSFDSRVAERAIERRCKKKPNFFFTSIIHSDHCGASSGSVELANLSSSCPTYPTPVIRLRSMTVRVDMDRRQVLCARVVSGSTS